MMIPKYFLDTCAILALTGNSQKSMSPEMIEKLSEASSIICVSPISLYEIGLKWHKTSGILNKSPEKLWHDALELWDWEGCPICSDDMVETYSLPPYHKDPFDRMIIAQAKRRHMPIVSCDRLFDSYDIQCLW